VSVLSELRECRQVLEPLIVRDVWRLRTEQLGTVADTHRSPSVSHLRRGAVPLIHATAPAMGVLGPNVNSHQGCEWM
jgi:hypothetical protein